MSISRMTDLTSIGTLFAFVLVCFGVLVLPRLSNDTKKKSFQLPYINGQYLIPILAFVFIYFGIDRISNAFTSMATESYQEYLYLIYVFVLILVAVLSFIRKYSVIPVIGAMCCMYLMIEIPPVSWLWFFIWMIIGLLFYSLYGRRNSILAK
jgi:APA family basic amino acid/polyamine antiporter